VHSPPAARCRLLDCSAFATTLTQDSGFDVTYVTVVTQDSGFDVTYVTVVTQDSGFDVTYVTVVTQDSGFDDAGAWHLDLLGKGSGAYAKWIFEEQEEFENKRTQQRINGEEESVERQPIWRATDHLLHIIIRTIETATHGADDLNVTGKEVKAFRERGSGSSGKRG
jgi:hypothetical protein